jgi:hypothetical protein
MSTEYKDWIGDHLPQDEQAALERACDEYRALQKQHNFDLSEGESCAFEAGWEAGIAHAKAISRR